MNINKVIIMGNLTRDTELRYLPSGKQVCNFSIASNNRYKKDDEWVDNVSYFEVVVFGKHGENCAEYLSKGSPVLVEGSLQQDRWEDKDGGKRSKVRIKASNVVFLSAAQPKQESVSEDDIPF